MKKLKIKTKEVEEFIIMLKENGFKVLAMEDDRNEGFVYDWGIFEKNDNIGYFQYDRFTGFSLSTKHKPNSSCGTGFNIINEGHNPTLKQIYECFSIAPHWASETQIKAVKKYKNLTEYLDNSFNKKYREI